MFKTLAFDQASPYDFSWKWIILIYVAVIFLGISLVKLTESIIPFYFTFLPLIIVHGILEVAQSLHTNGKVGNWTSLALSENTLTILDQTVGFKTIKTITVRIRHLQHSEYRTGSNYMKIELMNKTIEIGFVIDGQEQLKDFEKAVDMVRNTIKVNYTNYTKFRQ